MRKQRDWANRFRNNNMETLIAKPNEITKVLPAQWQQGVCGKLKGEGWSIEGGTSSPFWKGWMPDGTPEEVVKPKEGFKTFAAEFNKARAKKPGAVARLKTGPQRDLQTSARCCGMECQTDTKLSIAIREPRVLIQTARAVYAAIPNLIPFEVGGHWLTVPVSIGRDEVAFPHVLQELSEPILRDILEIAASIIGAAVLLHNSPGAGASQNHLHQHLIFRTSQLPIEKLERAQRNGHTHVVGYPAGVMVYSLNEEQPLWRLINNLQTEGVPFNMIIARGLVYCVGRRRRYEVGSVYQSSILAGYEYAGHWIVPDMEALTRINENLIEGALKESALTLFELLEYA